MPTVSRSRGDGSPKELQGFAKTWRTKYCAVQHMILECHFLHFSPPTLTSSIQSAMFIGARAPTEKLSLTECSVHDWETCLIIME